jgi:hypothetical protein
MTIMWSEKTYDGDERDQNWGRLKDALQQILTYVYS